MQAFDAFGALLRPLRDRASSWDEYVELPEAERRVQTYQAREHFDNPAAFADFLQADKPLVEGLSGEQPFLPLPPYFAHLM